MLNAEATAGQPSDVALLVVNDGTSPLLGVELTTGTCDRVGRDVLRAWGYRDPPRGVGAGHGDHHPSGEALAGDYRLTVSASVPDTDATDELELRMTVNTSPLWGLVGWR